MRENFDSEQELQFEALNLCFEANLPCAQEIKQRFHLTLGQWTPRSKKNEKTKSHLTNVDTLVSNIDKLDRQGPVLTGLKYYLISPRYLQEAGSMQRVPTKDGFTFNKF